MLRVIREVSPRWVVGENVRGLTNWNGGMVFEQVQVDLEALGYEVQSFILPAVAVNAPHRRDRVWIIAHRAGDRWKRPWQAAKDEKGYAARSAKTGELARGFERPYSDDSNANGARLQKCKGKDARTEGPKQWTDSVRNWNENWFNIATELCRVDDGLPIELDELKFTKSKHRAERLKSLGNAIVPQVAIQIFNSIKLYEKKHQKNC